MRYDVNGLIIKSENTAKSVMQPSRRVLDWIENIPRNHIVLDYGCGKLRYTLPLANRVNQIHGVDSTYQLNKTQTINGEMTSVFEYVEKNLDNVTVHEIGGDSWKKIYVDSAICTNVLSAIPFTEERINVLKNIKGQLKKNGKLLVTTQFRNSYFKSYTNREDIKDYNNGWLIPSRQGISYYGIITLQDLTVLCHEAGFLKVYGTIQGENAIAICIND
ncbi:methyltransferase domain-containing protein [Paenibacillus tepidiphilus]|uniref:methyltransferase domain-containing protein n=1 Tax=Paenibacillus tepidiphilus TaxID=2608683 RepID=UPI0013A56220|nr:methyltransferase domain-containing protein [Paenibacillus tepidiphilus]